MLVGRAIIGTAQSGGHGAAINESWTLRSDPWIEGSYQASLELLRSRLEIAGISALNDRPAIGALRAR